MLRALPLVLLLAAALALRAGGASAQGVPAVGGDAAAILDEALHWITRAIEVAGIAVIVGGALTATAAYGRHLLSGRTGTEDAYYAYRAALGRAILLGLEFLVAADIIGTVAIEPTIESVLVLGGVVLIRTFLSFSLEVEIEGHFPWRRREFAKEGERR